MANTRLGTRLQRLSDRMLGIPVVRDKKRGPQLTKEQRYVLEKGAESAWTFCTSRDPETNRPLIWTKDEQDKRAPLKPFPADLEYVHELFKIYENEKFVMLDKARQMFCTTSICLFSHWECLYRPARRIMLSKSTQDEANEILMDKVRFVHSNTPAWVQAYHRISSKPKNKINYFRTASVFAGVPQNVARRQSRGNSASRLIVDEGARQDQFAEIIASSLPMADQILALSTPEVGTPGAIAYKKYLDDVDDIVFEAIEA